MGGLAKKLFGTGKQEKLYVDDVFSAYLYTGNNSTQTINNGIDLAGEGGLVWFKVRDRIESHRLLDTVRGGSASLVTNTTNGVADLGSTGITAFNSNGFSIGSYGGINPIGGPTASWTFRRAPKFFDVITYTGNGASNRQIAHELGIAPGFITTKATSTTGDWNTYHRSATGDLKLNTTDAQAASRALITAADAGTFSVSGAANTNGVQYVSYLWAHDPSEDGIIQCGSFTINATGVSDPINLGYEPQFLLRKKTNAAGNWGLVDVMRGFNMTTSDAQLMPNLADAEVVASSIADPSATGFIAYGGSGETYIYLAIRRPNKPPKTGAEVYNAWTFNGTGGFQNMYAGFPPDTVITYGRSFSTAHCFVDRNRGSRIILRADSGGGTASESLAYAAPAFTGGYYGNISVGTDNISTTGLDWFGQSDISYVYHFFRRAPGFFDVVCFRGNESLVIDVPHNLQVKPELMIVKSRSFTSDWLVYSAGRTKSQAGFLNTTSAFSPNSAWQREPTSNTFKFFGANNDYVAYLFATKAGISKVGSYTGNGSSQTIDCGFTTGARFILVKRTDSPGDWYVWDTARGIIAANDPHLSLNTTAAEVTTDDSVDPAATGFIVNQNTATNINVNGASYIFLAIA